MVLLFMIILCVLLIVNTECTVDAGYRNNNVKLNAFVTPTTQTDCFNSVVSLYSLKAINNQIDGANSYISIGSNSSMLATATLTTNTQTSVYFKHAWLYGLVCALCNLQLYFGTKGAVDSQSCQSGPFTLLGVSSYSYTWSYTGTVQPGCTLFYATYNAALLSSCGTLSSTAIDNAAVVGAIWGQALPTSLPTSLPTALPTALPTVLPTALPTALPTVLPTSLPSVLPTSTPTTNQPSQVPSLHPVTLPPTVQPSSSPSHTPTTAPTQLPSNSSSMIPTHLPSLSPTATPSAPPTTSTHLPTTTKPSVTPTVSTHLPTITKPSVAPIDSTHLPTTTKPSVTPIDSTHLPTTTKPSVTPTVSTVPVSYQPTVTSSPTVFIGVAQSIQKKTKGTTFVDIGVATVVVASFFFCLFVMYLYYKRRQAMAKGMKDLQAWIQHDQASGNSLGSVKVADWKRDQLVDIEGVLYLSPRFDDMNHKSSMKTIPSTSSSSTTFPSSGTGTSMNGVSNNRAHNHMKNNESAEISTTLHSIQQQLKSLSGVNPLSIQTTTTSVGGAESIKNPMNSLSTPFTTTTSMDSITTSSSSNDARFSPVVDQKKNHSATMSTADINDSYKRKNQSATSTANAPITTSTSMRGIHILPSFSTLMNSSSSNNNMDAISSTKMNNKVSSSTEENVAITERPSMALDLRSVYKNNEEDD